MKNGKLLCNRWGGYSLWISILGLLGLLDPSEVAGGKKAKRKAKSPAEMVEAIVSPNKPPKLGNNRRGPGYPKRHQFPKDYDWKKQNRVYKALAKVYKDTSVEMWEEQVRKSGDSRYSLTVTSQVSEYSYNETVGLVCRDLAYRRLIGVFRRHLPKVKGAPPGNPYVRLNVGVDLSSLSEWRKKRKDKSLWELQIEVCDRALEELPKAKRVSQAEKDAARKKIVAEIENLKRTKRPILIKYNLYGQLLAPYTTGEAK